MTKIAELLRSVTARDLRFAALIAVLLTLSPATGSARKLISALLGTAGAAFVLAVLVWQRQRYGAPAVPARAASAPETSRWPDPLALAALAAVAIAFAPTIAWLFYEYTYAQWRNVHGVFVPLFVFLLARSALRRDPEPGRRESSAWGFVPLIAGLGLVVLDAGVRSHYLAAVGLVLCVPGLSLLFLGARRTRLIAAPLALCVFALPVPEELGDPLRINAITCDVANRLLDMSDLTFLRHHTTFMTRNGPINVAQNCSGLAVLYAGAALSLVLVYGARTWLRRIAILLLVLPLVVLANSVRVAGMVFLVDRLGQDFLSNPLHGLAGVLVLWFVVGCLWLSSDHRGLREALA